MFSACTRNRPFVSVILPTVMLWAAAISTSNGWSADFEAFASGDIMRSDVIVRGTVESVEIEMVPASEFEPEWTMGGYFHIARVTLRVAEVLLGTVNDDPTVTFLVNQDRSDIEGSYAVDDEVVMALEYDPSFRGGALELRSGHGHLVRQESEWITQTGARFSTEALRAVADRASLEGVVAASTKIVVGEIVSATTQDLRDPSDSRRHGAVWLVNLKPDRWIKDRAPDSGLVVFKSFIGGTYRPGWASMGPKELQVGQKYCVFLHDEDGELVVTGGVTGLLRVQSDGTLVRNNRPLKQSVAYLATLVGE